MSGRCHHFGIPSSQYRDLLTNLVSKAILCGIGAGLGDVQCTMRDIAIKIKHASVLKLPEFPDFSFAHP